MSRIYFRCRHWRLSLCKRKHCPAFSTLLVVKKFSMEIRPMGCVISSAIGYRVLGSLSWRYAPVKNTGTIYSGLPVLPNRR